jgi:trans-aconitate methyltransferase
VTSEHRIYGDLAVWWPLISPPEEYADEAAVFVAMLTSGATTPVGDVLELGSGGGHNAVHIKAHFAMTLVDRSADMLDVSRRLNPDCEHQQGDMRTVRLGRAFDAVFVHDAVDYMTSEADLGQVIDTAFAHCRPGGIALFVPDHTTETFEAGSEHGGSDDADGRGARYLAWTWDPDPADTSIITEYAFLLREADGSVRAVHETHRTGLFSRDVWVRLLADAGFDPYIVTEQTGEDRVARDLFLARRP